MRILVAARLSQLADGQTGLDSQDAESKTWAAAGGHEIVHVAADRKSGTSAPWDRPNLKPWVTDRDKIGQYDAVLAYRLDRLSRGDNQSTNDIERWAHEHGKLLLTVDGLRYPCEGNDGIRWDVTKRIAHQEWLSTSERYRRMQNFLKAEGKLVGRPPFGYEAVPAEGGHKTIAPTEEGRRLIPEIFSRCIAGESLVTIATWLTGETGKSWWPKVVGQMIRCTTYMGYRQDASGKTILRCEPVVDAAAFTRAGQSLDNRPKRGPSDIKNRAMLAECVFCPKCEGPMYKIAAGNGNKHFYYRCAGRGPVRKSTCRNMVRLAWVDRLVTVAISVTNTEMKETRVIPGHDHSAEIEEIKFQIRSLDIDDSDYDEKHAALMAERKKLAGMPSVPDRIESISTGQTYAEAWAGLSEAERGDWLRSKNVRVLASREGIGIMWGSFASHS